jgi:hypothetical protein
VYAEISTIDSKDVRNWLLTEPTISPFPVNFKQFEYKEAEELNCKLVNKLTIPAEVSIFLSIYAQACDTFGRNIANTINIQKVITPIKIKNEHVKYIIILIRTTVQQVITIAEMRPSKAMANTIP